MNLTKGTKKIDMTEDHREGTITTWPALANKVYEDLVRGSLKSFGEVLTTYSKVLREKIQGKLHAIPENRRTDPPLSLVYEVLRQGTLAYDTQVLQEMFSNLLASASDLDRESYAHPSFVDRIRQMSETDALIFNHLAHRRPMVLPGATILRKAYIDHPTSDAVGLRHFFRYLNLDEEIRSLIPLERMPISLENLVWLGLIEVVPKSETQKSFRKYGEERFTLSCLEVFYFSQVLKDPEFGSFMKKCGLVGDQVKCEAFLVHPTPVGRDFMRSCVYATDEERKEFVDSRDPRFDRDKVFQFLEVRADGKSPTAVLLPPDHPSIIESSPYAESP